MVLLAPHSKDLLLLTLTGDTTLIMEPPCVPFTFRPGFAQGALVRLGPGISAVVARGYSQRDTTSWEIPPLTAHRGA